MAFYRGGRGGFRNQDSYYDRRESFMPSRSFERGRDGPGMRSFDGPGMRSFDRETRDSNYRKSKKSTKCRFTIEVIPKSASADIKEIATKTLYIQSKKFYVDVKESKRGKFLKISEVAPNGQKMRIIMDMSTGGEFHDKLSEFCETYTNLGPGRVEAVDNEGKIKSESIFRESRRYYLDLKENHRGRFLKVSMTLPSHERTQIVIPAHGMIDLRDTLTDILHEHGREDTATSSNSNQITTGGKTFFFDVGNNARGTYLRISEVSGSLRSTLTIPESAWADFIASTERATEKSTGNK